ncbi:EthD family reductase [Pseudonocardia sp. NPDC046786]|uniref:EthD family reductase n=1 Tax=Pseudonocardia sp. NPDC046786 TaxID=3155471 RepID=UPI0033E043F1
MITRDRSPKEQTVYILTVAYGHPTDPSAFDSHYENVHLPLAGTVPGVRATRVLRCSALDDTHRPTTSSPS